MERILIIFQMLNEARFGDSEDDRNYGINKLLRMGAVKDVYPLHDGPYQYDDEPDEFLNDRQLLLKHWANFSVWYKEQPLNLIEKYYGTEVAFYFAWLGFYNMMLIPASIIGLICFTVGLVQLLVAMDPVVEDICNSDLTMCPRCTFGHTCVVAKLNKQCNLAKAFVIFDNYATVFFAVFMSFWANAFISLWKNFENVLKIRWNVTAATIHAKTQTRLLFKENAPHVRISKITGKLEHYTPVGRQICYYILSFGACGLLVSVVLTAVIGVIIYRITVVALIVMSGSDHLNNNPFIESCTSAVLQVIFIKIYGSFYAPLSEWLTNMENPRTHFEFDNSVVHKRYILGFANNYASLIYMSFFKGRFYWPARVEVGSLETDLCHVCGCLFAVCIQLFVIMLLKSMAGNILTLIVPIITRRFPTNKKQENLIPQWEEEFQLYPAGRYLLTTEFMEMIIQYGFVTFFVAAFPLAPLCALINNSMELRLDALKLVTRYRRPVPKKQSGIGPWKDLLQVITHLSVATNAFVLSFTSDFVAREIYKFKHGNSLFGYVNSTLSVFDMEEIEDNIDHFVGSDFNTTLCYYKGLRHPPGHPYKYEHTPYFWFEIGMRLLCVIIFEHIITLINGVFLFFIPEIPQKVRDAVFREYTRNQDNAFRKMDEEANRVRRIQKKPKIKIE